MPTDVEEWKAEVYGTDIREHIERFAAEGWDSIPEDERDAWFERFKWYGLYHQRAGQESYFMMRIGTPNGVLEPGQLRVVGEVAQEYASGPVSNPEFGDSWADYTTRQAIQLHWIKVEDIVEVWDALESAGLSTVQACGDSWRNIVGCPVAGKDEHEHVDALETVYDFQREFKENDRYENMPRKWKVAVNGCREGCGQGDINDLSFEPATKDGVKGYNVRVGGGLARNEPRLARDIDVFVPHGKAAKVADGVSALFEAYGNREDRYSARIKFLVDEWGAEKVRRVLQEEFVDFELQSAGEDFRDEYSYNAGREGDGHDDHVGVHPQADGKNYVGLNVLVGRMGTEDVLELADLADEYGSGEVRLTQRQNVIVTDVPDENLDELLAEDLLVDYEPDPSPFMRGSIACTGTEFCSLSIVETKNRMVRYARHLRDTVDLPDEVEDFHVHLSGCTASCAQPQIADVSLRGMKTRKDGEPVEAFDLGLGGGLGENPRFADWVGERIPADEVPGAIANLVDSYKAQRDGSETFRDFVERHDEDDLEALVEPEETSYEDPMMHNTKRTWYPYAEDDDMAASPAPTDRDGVPLDRGGDDAAPADD
ncbi:ferredoxin--nitrite reductase [Halorubellus sp. JP-L1]|uniref:nitrite/sulfite reductase n=1 Tax=Halorubellus sp. JP-L1 TaxID=2715753 RepID=UPI00140C8AD9|nr:ferredoxin--nitrite reductase [Halorubellus sp. JP-L1]NHN41700.1 ferredoxin--nitrite reductase [Halorubellus sp. JP-L1]